MILDTSVIVAIACREPGYEELIARLESADTLAVGAPTIVVSGIMLESRLGTNGRSLLERFLTDFDVTVVDFGELHWREAIDAYRRFGKGRHSAALNFDDCLSYAVASVAEEPLLFVGDDFRSTDIVPA